MKDWTRSCSENTKAERREEKEEDAFEEKISLKFGPWNELYDHIIIIIFLKTGGFTMREAISS